MAVDKNIKLYIHIPFCVKKCNYCDFLSFPVNEDTKEKYVKALLLQIEMEAQKAKEKGYCERVSSVYMGGGTPSCLNENQIALIMNKIYDSFEIDEDSENTIEVNPGTVELCKLINMREHGFNRLSIGMQSANDKELKELGRIHTYKEFLDSFWMARRAGFDNINVDVMTALYGQDENSLRDTLEKVISLGPEHISAYSLIIEEGTPFYEKYGNIDGPVVGEKLERKLYHMSTKTLEKAGYEHYEISNFAKPGYRSNHNCGYWNRTPYIGLGLGASSFIWEENKGVIIEKRIRNTADLRTYFDNPMAVGEEELIGKNEAMDEFMFLGLRMMEGVNSDIFQERFGLVPEKVYGPQINKLIAENLLINNGTGYALTNLGIDYGNYVFSEFLR